MAKPKEDENDIHALDLPQLYTKPAAPVLLSTLHVLALAVPSWDSSVVGEDHAHSINPAGLPSYLTSIIASPLSWIDDENEREEIWQTASKRLTERSGRNGEH
ncbi:MAG: hypothetical protein M1837_002096 [Sclerophora amabilis]|nr:MAG: hypothetical protein M1837_002096 [Sclerophora amabilis]